MAGDGIKPLRPNGVVIHSREDALVEGTEGADQVEVRGTSTGRVIVHMNGRIFDVARDAAQDLTIRTHGGDDVVVVRDSVRSRLRIHGGAGNDRIVGGSGNDRLYGGAGRDVLDGGAGDDYVEGNGGHDVVRGGEGRDVLYGLGGDDTLDGGPGADYIDGGPGQDSVFGQAGNDALIGGRGDDLIVGGAGDDVIAPGPGADQVMSLEGVDRVCRHDDDHLVGSRSTLNVFHEFIDFGRAHAAPRPKDIAQGNLPPVEGRGTFEIAPTASPEFEARFRSDLDALRSTPAGQRLLKRLEKTPATLVVNETTNDQEASWVGRFGGRWNVLGYNRSQLNTVDGREAMIRARGGDVDEIRARDYTHSPPVVLLAHELVHALHQFEGDRSYGAVDGPGSASNEELRTTGLPYDHDNDPSTPRQTDPTQLTENAVRSDLGLPQRARYYNYPVKGDGETR